MKRVHGMELKLPEGKLPGFYAQIVKKLAETNALADRDRSLLFVYEEGRDAVERLLEHYKVPAETGPWLQLGAKEDGWKTGRVWTDYGVETRSGNLFLDLSLATLISLEPGMDDGAEPAQAGLQLEEHAAAFKPAGNGSCGLYALDRQLDELAQGIAKAYRCVVADRDKPQ
ncbi:hypothetical protein BG53_14585 [Paenibacillus darwinianus]|uniref:Uncharacterized protein n=1 Tax=Paenibacillus darwinianus TaxID=1380763 RepID=A0A9W5S3R7_9BACL|nr:hypothetical protein [Paenibacillus darwinianus]EXX91847.1 hypothetical protein BG52_06730 [Paenibacillus darwinianus]EXX92365.1 hypothetical protein BG53_14585 [Paenibacillus darwinianus]EXX92735.1 hypothetical protein CH50_02040 [Paenibacillus darwinianus]